MQLSESSENFDTIATIQGARLYSFHKFYSVATCLVHIYAMHKCIISLLDSCINAL